MGRELSDYRAALDYLFARTSGKTKVGLERVRAFLAALGDPHRRLRVLHVAGTNGKGSVVATLDALLRGRGLRVGRYTSPHLVDFRERIVVDGDPIEPRAVVEFVRRWAADAERAGTTFFEATTAMAFEHFARAAVDVAVVETGLGGRLDATNVVHPVAAGVTSIAVDHVEYLGSTLAEIAMEKAGIFKAGAPAVIGEGDDGLADLLAAHARSAGAGPVLRVGADARLGKVEVAATGTRFELQAFGEAATLTTPLAGVHQAANTATALLMLGAAGAPFAVSLPEAARLLPAVRLPGRFQHAGRYLFDVAHNPAGAAVLAATLARTAPPRPVVAVLAVLADKDWAGMMRALAPAVDRFLLTTAPTAPASRLWRPADAYALARQEGWEADLEPDFDGALERAAVLGATVLVTGSFHTVGDAMERLQVDPLAG